jgi:hypothetical protein
MVPYQLEMMFKANVLWFTKNITQEIACVTPASSLLWKVNCDKYTFNHVLLYFNIIL